MNDAAMTWWTLRQRMGDGAVEDFFGTLDAQQALSAGLYDVVWADPGRAFDFEGEVFVPSDEESGG